MSSPKQPSKSGADNRSGNRSNDDRANGSAANSGSGAKYRTIKDSPYKGTISKEDARSAARLVKSQRSSSK